MTLVCTCQIHSLVLPSAHPLSIFDLLLLLLFTLILGIVLDSMVAVLIQFLRIHLVVAAIVVVGVVVDSFQGNDTVTTSPMKVLKKKSLPRLMTSR